VNDLAVFNTVAQEDYLGFYEGDEFHAKRVVDFLNLDKAIVSKISDVAKGSVRFDSRIPKPVYEHLLQIGNVCLLVAKQMDGNAEKTRLWFDVPNPMLGGVTPRTMIRAGRYKKLYQLLLMAIDEAGE